MHDGERVGCIIPSPSSRVSVVAYSALVEETCAGKLMRTNVPKKGRRLRSAHILGTRNNASNDSMSKDMSMMRSLSLDKPTIPVMHRH